MLTLNLEGIFIYYMLFNLFILENYFHFAAESSYSEKFVPLSLKPAGTISHILSLWTP